MNQPRQFYLSVLLLKGEVSWVVQCLEYDITAQGTSIRKAMKAFERTIVGQIVLDIKQGKEPLQDIGQAPKEYWEKFKHGDKLGEPESFQLPEFLPGFVASAQQKRICA